MAQIPQYNAQQPLPVPRINPHMYDPLYQAESKKAQAISHAVSALSQVGADIATRVVQSQSQHEADSAWNDWQQAQADYFQNADKRAEELASEVGQAAPPGEKQRSDPSGYLLLSDDYKKFAADWWEQRKEKFSFRYGRDQFERRFNAEVTDKSVRVKADGYRRWSETVVDNQGELIDQAAARGDLSGAMSMVQDLREQGLVTPVVADNKLDSLVSTDVYNQRVNHALSLGLDDGLKFLANPENWNYRSWDGKDVRMNPESQQKAVDRFTELIKLRREEEKRRLDELDNSLNETMQNLFRDYREGKADLSQLRSVLDTDRFSSGMKEPTWSKWDGRIQGILDGGGKKADSATAETVKTDLVTKIYGGQASHEQIDRLITEGAKIGTLDSADVQSLYGLNDRVNPNPVMEGIFNELQSMASELDVPPEKIGQIRNDLIDLYDTARAEKPGTTPFKNFTGDDFVQAARNLMYSAVEPESRKKVREAYNIQRDQLQPAADRSKGLFSRAWEMGARGGLDTAERRLQSIGSGEYLGWQYSPTLKQQMVDTWNAYQSMFKDRFGKLPENENPEMDENGYPIYRFSQRTGEGQQRAYRVVIPDGGTDEQWQIWDPRRKGWRPLAARSTLDVPIAE